jgi:hypothetical protein
MPINVNGTTITGGTSLTATDVAGNKLFVQDNLGRISKASDSLNSSLLPMFMVGMSGAAWEQPVTAGTYGKLPFNYSGGSGYRNTGSCYDLTNSRFNVPQQGFYLFKVHNYCYHPDSAVTHYCHPLFYVNGSSNYRRAGGTTYRMRQYGFPGSYGHDTDCCELIYLYPTDYVEAWWYDNSGMQAYDPYCSFSGCYIGT